jgi:hypothetical protein
VTIAAHRDLLVLHPRGRIEDQSRALHIAIRQRRRASAPLKLTTILIAKLDPVAADPGHDA